MTISNVNQKNLKIDISQSKIALKELDEKTCKKFSKQENEQQPNCLTVTNEDHGISTFSSANKSASTCSHLFQEKIALQNTTDTSVQKNEDNSECFEEWKKYPKKKTSTKTECSPPPLLSEDQIFCVKNHAMHGTTFVGVYLRKPSETPGIIIDAHQPKHIKLPSFPPYTGGKGTKFQSESTADFLATFDHLVSTPQGNNLLNQAPKSEQERQPKIFSFELPPELEKTMLQREYTNVRVNAAWSLAIANSWEVHLSPGDNKS